MVEKNHPHPRAINLFVDCGILRATKIFFESESAPAPKKPFHLLQDDLECT
jgi:hypothetical protein